MKGRRHAKDWHTTSDSSFSHSQLLPGSDEAVESRVQRQEFIRYLDLTGDLKALETVQVTSPNLGSKWSFVVSYLIPEGSLVQPGDLLAQFDIAELISERLELEKKREDARIQIAQKQAEQEIEELDLLLNLARADKSYRVFQGLAGAHLAQHGSPGGCCAGL